MDDTERAQRHRVENLDGIEEHSVSVPSEVRSRVLEDSGGNALDSVVASFAAHRNTVSGLQTSWVADREVEGHIYV